MPTKHDLTQQLTAIETNAARIGEAKYLRLRWHETPTRCPYIDVATPYDGPDGKRQTYIGADPERILEARARVARRNQWLDLTRQIDQHANTIHRLYRQLSPY